MIEKSKVYDNNIKISKNSKKILNTLKIEIKLIERAWKVCAMRGGTRPFNLFEVVSFDICVKVVVNFVTRIKHLVKSNGRHFETIYD